MKKLRKAKVASLRKFLRGLERLEPIHVRRKKATQRKGCGNSYLESLEPIHVSLENSEQRLGCGNSYLDSLEPIHVSRKILDNERGSAIPTWKAWGQFML
jgi:hypothetical protein